MLSIADKRSLVFSPEHSQLMCFLRGIGLETRTQRLQTEFKMSFLPPFGLTTQYCSKLREETTRQIKPIAGNFLHKQKQQQQKTHNVSRPSFINIKNRIKNRVITYTIAE